MGVRIVLLAMGAGFLVNLALGWMALRTPERALAFALLGMLLGGVFGVVEVALRRRWGRAG
jgi:Flp pilus assembly protein protease CpaA